MPTLRGVIIAPALLCGQIATDTGYNVVTLSYPLELLHVLICRSALPRLIFLISVEYAGRRVLGVEHCSRVSTTKVMTNIDKPGFRYVEARYFRSGGVE